MAAKRPKIQPRRARREARAPAWGPKGWGAARGRAALHPWEPRVKAAFLGTAGAALPPAPAVPQGSISRGQREAPRAQGEGQGGLGKAAARPTDGTVTQSVPPWADSGPRGAGDSLSARSAAPGPRAAGRELEAALPSQHRNRDGEGPKPLLEIRSERRGLGAGSVSLAPSSQPHPPATAPRLCWHRLSPRQLLQRGAQRRAVGCRARCCLTSWWAPTTRSLLGPSQTSATTACHREVPGKSLSASSAAASHHLPLIRDTKCSWRIRGGGSSPTHGTWGQLRARPPHRAPSQPDAFPNTQTLRAASRQTHRSSCLEETFNIIESNHPPASPGPH